MRVTKVAITIDRALLTQLDRLVKMRVLPNRSKTIQDAIQDKLTRINRSHLARECSKFNPKSEKALAEEGIAQELSLWPEY